MAAESEARGSVLDPRRASSKPWAAPLGGPQARAGFAELKIFARQPKSLALGEEGPPLSRNGARGVRAGRQEGREGDEGGQQGQAVLVADGGGEGQPSVAIRNFKGATARACAKRFIWSSDPAMLADPLPKAWTARQRRPAALCGPKPAGEGRMFLGSWSRRTSRHSPRSMRECGTKAGPEEAKSQTLPKISPPRKKSVLEALPWLSCLLIPGSKA